MAPNTPSASASVAQGPSTSTAQIIQEMQQRIMGLKTAQNQGGDGLRISKPDHFDGTKKKLRPWLAQMDINMSAQSHKLGTEADKTMLAISYHTGKAADWAQPYVKDKFHGGSNNE